MSTTCTISPRNPAQRRYTIRIAIAASAYVVSLAFAQRYIEPSVTDNALAWLLALLPGLSVAGFFWAIGRLLVEEKDEYQRMLLVRQNLFASGFTLSILTIWGFLGDYGLVQPLEGFWVAILFFFALGLGACVNKLSRPRGGDAQ